MKIRLIPDEHLKSRTMSRLDYITIGIVAVCLLAIIFLVYKMTDLFDGGKANDKIETVQDSVELEDDGVYDYEIDEEVDSTTTGQPATDDAPQTQPATPAPAVPAKEPETKPAPKASTGGKFMVLGGTFTKKYLAEEKVAKLKKLGYNNASLEIFDRGKYAVVLVDRFDSMVEAERLARKLEGDGITCYIKMKDR